MMHEFRADLHCHSTCSDGTFSPEKLVSYAREIGLCGLSITDHDTINAYATALPLAKEIALLVISGVEFSCVLDGASVHLLGYAFSLCSPAIFELCKRHSQRRKNRNLAILNRLARHGMPIAEEDLIQGHKGDMDSIGRVHIAQAMVNKHYVATIQEAFQKFISEGQPCFDSGEGISVQETVDCIREAGGKAVIAHPHLINDQTVINKLLQIEFDGIEVHYGRFLPAQVQRWSDIADERGWLKTGGSDFHGTVRPQSFLGSSWVSEDVFKPLYELFLKNNPLL